MLTLRVTHLLVAAFLVFQTTVPVFATGSVTLTSIGTLNTSGSQYPEWWYSGENPTLTGTAAANAPITLTIDGTSSTLTADATGHWSSPTTMTTGDHQVSLNSEGSTYSFILHVGQAAPDGMTGSTSDTPVAGSVLPTLGIAAVGLAFILFGFKLARA